MTFQGAEAVTWKHFAKKIVFKNFRIQRKIPVPEPTFKVAEYFKKETLAQVFLCKFHKTFKKCFGEAMFCETSTKVCF